jgi:hypothetical protein
MKRCILVCAATAAAMLVSSGASARSGAVCIGNGSNCYPTIQAAVDAASNGDTILVPAGTFAGGITIDKSVQLVGAGAKKTVIRGGGPVITIGVQLDPNPPTVTIRGVTITGGVTTHDGANTFAALGGGVYVQIGADFGRGATVTIADSVVTGNRAAPSNTVPDGAFALAQGAGIDNFGDLRVVNSQVTNNVAGSLPGDPSIATEGHGGGIYNHIQAALTLDRSVVSGNQVHVTSGNEGQATAGGIYSLGDLTVRHSIVSDNTAELDTPAPASVDQSAFAGGIQMDFCPVEFCGPPHSGTVTDTIVRGNRAIAQASNTGGLAVAFAGGIWSESPLLVERSTVTDNDVRATSAGDAAGDGGGFEVDGPATVRDSLVARNSVVMEAAGAVLAQGGGFANAGQLTVERTLVLNNSASAHGAGGDLPFGSPSAAQGGGIWNGSFGGDTPPQLTLTASAILHNSLDASTGITTQGGGLYTDFPVTLTRTPIAANRPDQCFGC